MNLSLHEPKSSIGLDTLVSFIAVSYPYTSQFVISGGLDVGTVLLCCALLIVCSTRPTHRIYSWVGFSLYCGVSTVFAISFGYMIDVSVATSLLRLIKMVTAFLFVALNSDILNYRVFVKHYLRISDIATFMMILQMILYYIFHISLVVGGRFTIERAISSRPSSIFSEPSQYTNFILVALAYSIFSEKRKTEDMMFYKRRGLYSLGILISTSGQGYVMLAGLWIMYILYTGIITRKYGRMFGYVVLLACLTGIAIQFEVVQTSIGRFFSDTSETGFSSAVTGRLVGFDFIKEYSPLQAIIGKGFGNRASGVAVTQGVIYYNGISSIIAGSGYIGLLAYLHISAKYFIRASISGKALIIALWALMFSANLFYAPYIVLYFSILNADRMQRYHNTIL